MDNTRFQFAFRDKGLLTLEIYSAIAIAWTIAWTISYIVIKIIELIRSVNVPTCSVSRDYDEKAWCLDTRGFIPKKIEWHIHTGPWSLVNSVAQSAYETLYKGLMNINEMAVNLEDDLSLYGDRCFSLIPRHSVQSVTQRLFTQS